MDNLIFLWDFPLIFNSIDRYSNYNRILIVDKEKRMPAYIVDRNSLNKYFDEIIEVNNIFDKEEMVNTIKNMSGNIKAIYATYESIIEMAGYLRETFNVQGMIENECINVRNKYKMKEVVRRNNIKTSVAEIIHVNEDIDKFIESNGYPIIIKPIDGLATINTYKISNSEQLSKVKLNIKSLISKFKFIAETFVNGEEYHCDSIVQGNEVMFSSVGKYLNNCIDTVNSDKPVGAIIYPKINDESNISNRIKQVNKAVVEAFNIKNAVCHAEYFVDGTNIYFGEIATRIGGGPLIGNSIDNSWGVNIYNAFIDVELGNYKPNQEREDGIYTGFVAFPTALGVVKRISLLEQYEDIEGLKQIKIFNKIGDSVRSKDNTADRTGYIIIEDKSYEKLKTKLMSAYCNFELEVE